MSKRQEKFEIEVDIVESAVLSTLAVSTSLTELSLAWCLVDALYPEIRSTQVDQLVIDVIFALQPHFIAGGGALHSWRWLALAKRVIIVERYR